MSLRHLQVYAAGWDPPESPERAGRGAGQDISITCQQSWLTGEVPDDWRIANVTPIYKKSWKEDSGNYRPVGLTSVPGKVMK